MPSVGTPCSESFQPIRCASASRPASDCGTRGEGPDAGDPGRDGVVALGLGADHGLVDAAGAALEDLAVLVDEEVVADVVPAVGVAVVAGDPEHDPGRLLGRVVVGADRVVHERGLDLAVLGRRARRHAVAAPLGAGDDRGLARLRLARLDLRASWPGGGRSRGGRRARSAGRARSGRAGRAPSRAGAAGRRRRRRCRRARCRRGRGRRRARGRRRWWSGIHGVQPPPRRRARTWASSVAAARPAQPDQVEAARRVQDGRGAPARDVGGALVEPRARTARSRRRRRCVGAARRRRGRRRRGRWPLCD